MLLFLLVYVLPVDVIHAPDPDGFSDGRPEHFDERCRVIIEEGFYGDARLEMICMGRTTQATLA